MKSHRFADIFPLLDGRDLHALSRDIAENGQREPILTYHGQVLDGRNRLAACELAGVKPTFKVFEGDEYQALRAVISLNLHRRHLSESQRAVVGARLATLSDGQRADLARSANLPTLSQPEAAEMLNVSERSIRNARVVLEEGGPELVAKVNAGEIKVSTAAKVVAAERAVHAAAKKEEVNDEWEQKEQSKESAKKCSDSQPPPIDPKTARKWVTNATNVMGDTVLDQLDELTKQLPDMDIGLDPKEISQCAHVLLRASRSLKRLAEALRTSSN